MSEYRDHSREFMMRFYTHVVRATNKTAMQVYRDAKLNISGHHGMPLKAVDTGRLMNSIAVISSETGIVEDINSGKGGKPPVRKGQVEVKATQADRIKKPEQEQGSITSAIGSNVEYAPYIELGTIKMGPRPFLRTALEMNKNTFANHLKFNPDSMGTETV